MKKKLAIKGHSTRGKEVIKVLEMLGGTNPFSNGMVIGNKATNCYYISENTVTKYISWDYIGPEEINEYKIFTLEEFLEKYPFNVGDKVFDTADGDPGIITAMKWDEDVSDMKYHIAFDNGDMGWFTIDTFGFLKKDKNLELEKMSVKNHKMGPKSKLPSKYYEDRLKEIQTKRDMDNTIFMIGPVIVPDKVDDKLEYKIPDNYEFDVVVDGKIFLKPIKPKYPTTYEDCCKVLGISYRAQLSYTYPDVERGNIYLTKEKHLLDAFMKLRICRNAYWRIAGEEIGLDKSWESPLPSLFEIVYCIRRKNNEIIKGAYRGGKSEILEFPTEEMRDAFYENFKKEIEQCKELL